MTKSASTATRARAPARRQRKTVAPTPATPARDLWSSRFVFVMASASAVVWLNNLSQFPYLVDRHGGSAFLLAYVVCLMLIGLPVMIVEFLLGRLGEAASPPEAIRRVAQQAGVSDRWSLLGIAVTVSGFLIFCYYSVFAGWTLAHVVRAGAGAFSGLTADGVASLFSAFVRDPEKQLFWHALFVAVVAWISSRGVKRGIEAMLRFVWPAIVFALLVLLLYAAALGALPAAFQRLFMMDLTRLSGEAILAAAGQAFFGLALGLGVLMAYASHASPETGITRAARRVILIDVGVALLGALPVFAVLHAAGVVPAPGADLVFQAMPVAFDHLPGGRVMGTLFFAMLVLIAVMSAVALLEPAVAWLVERRQFSRAKAAGTAGAAAWFIGVAVILSFSYWSFSFSFLGIEKRYGIFDALLVVTSNFLLPLAVIGLLLFAGWRLNRNLLEAQAQAASPCLFELWLWSVRVVTPLLILLLSFNVHKLFL